jgi:cystathionine beta-synthase
VRAGEDMARVFKTPVKEVMVGKLETISADAPVSALPPLFERGLVPLVIDGDRFLGLVTRIDLINHFRIRAR